VVDQVTRQTKRQIRTAVLSARAELEEATTLQRAKQFADQIDGFARQHEARTVAAYASVGNEPGTREAIARLHARGVRVLLPVVLPDLDLDWADFAPDAWQDSRLGLVEPMGARLGLDAISEADVIFCPGVAGSPDGRRLGRGGGCYDQALTRSRPDATRCLIVYDENVLDDIPVDEHDQPVDAIITPTRVIATNRA
jgi:5-formyltetrahydrofolate cyclo-ligase